MDSDGRAGANKREEVGQVGAERTKLTAAYLNAGATGLFTTGVVAPIAATAFGFAGTTVSLLTLALGVLIFLAASLALHAAARYVLTGLNR